MRRAHCATAAVGRELGAELVLAVDVRVHLDLGDGGAALEAECFEAAWTETST